MEGETKKGGGLVQIKVGQGVKEALRSSFKVLLGGILNEVLDAFIKRYQMLSKSFFEEVLDGF